MDIKDAIRSVRKHWVVVVVFTLLGVCGATFFVVRATPKYQSDLTFFVSTPASDATAALAANQFATQRVNSYIRVASSQLLASMVVSQTGLQMDPVALSHEISASADLNTVILSVSVVDPTRARSLQIATAVSTELPKAIARVETSTGAANKVKLTVTSAPRLSPDPVRPSRLLTIGLGVLIGLLIGIAIAILRDLFDTTVRSEDVLREVTDHPVLASMSFDPTAHNEPLLVSRQVHSTRAESFRALRTNLKFMSVDNSAQVIVVTSSVANEGKSTTSANLAIVFAESGRSTLLIEADLRRPRVTEYLGLERTIGLSNVLAGQVVVDEVLQRWGDSGLTVLSGGTVPPNPSEILGSHGMLNLIKSMRDRYDMIIIDTPPLLPVTDAAVASVLADGVVMVVRYGKTTRHQLTAAMRSLETVDARVLGSVLNMAKRRGALRDGYDGYSHYGDEFVPPEVATDGRVHVAPSDDPSPAHPGSLTDSTVARRSDAPADKPPSARRSHGTTVAGTRRRFGSDPAT